MMDELARLRESAMSDVAAAGSTEELEEVSVRFVGRKARVNEILKGIRGLEDADKRVVGPAANALRKDVEEAVRSRREQLEREREVVLLATDRLDLTLTGRRPPRGAPNPLTEVTRSLEDVFVGLGYEVAEGPEVETDWNNFQALNTPPDHPARSEMDTFYVPNPHGGPPGLLRTHTSPVQVRVMSSRTPPIYVVCPGRTFRRDTADATHSPMFHQIELLAVDEGLSMADLRGTLEAFAEGAFGRGTRIRLVPHFFPFTEPSAELEVSCPLCRGTGCSQCASGWLEIGGAGMVDPNVLVNVGIDPERYTGFAFGMGIERVAMIRYGVADLRLFFEADVRFLDQFRGIPVTS
ncbi:MAG TPA: phenylalanine--tRNA ligase subunit alpha [Actinomycetota bacterium]|nr:phenylalanine--tRNA ligase subunit alpha [Actinomycetota bacterium]